MTDKLYDVSNRLFLLRRDFMPHEVDGVSMSGNDVRLLNALLFDLGREVLAVAHQVTGYHWPNTREIDLPINAQLMNELSRPGSNIVLFKPDLARREA